ncbi:hypothetical protein V8E53_005824 [Lactarius tabidus]
MTGWTPDSLTVTVVGSIGTFELPNPYEKMEDSMIPCVISHAFSHSFLPFLQTSSRRCQGLRDILSRFHLPHPHRWYVSISFHLKQIEPRSQPPTVTFRQRRTLLVLCQLGQCLSERPISLPRCKVQGFRTAAPVQTWSRITEEQEKVAFIRCATEALRACVDCYSEAAAKMCRIVQHTNRHLSLSVEYSRLHVLLTEFVHLHVQRAVSQNRRR